MKHFFCFMIFIAVLVMLSSCSFVEEKKGSKDPSSQSTAESGELVVTDVFSSVNIAGEKLEVTSSLGNKYVWNGTEIQEDMGIDLEVAREQLHAQIEGKTLCPMVSDDLELRFTDKIPTSIKWYNHYYIDANTEEFIYLTLQNNNTVADDEIGASVTFPVGTDLAAPLFASDPSPAYYRMLRIVCTFEDQTMEYFIFIDCTNAEDTAA